MGIRDGGAGRHGGDAASTNACVPCATGIRTFDLHVSEGPSFFCIWRIKAAWLRRREGDADDLRGSFWPDWIFAAIVAIAIAIAPSILSVINEFSAAFGIKPSNPCEIEID
uniref:Uncharacterized protein n=1 Tax=Coccidioides posadasii RMSCC 3488 TaxID=454284 RepID=A0A0J6FHR3_COCPO|nr:hypothetical protein CPAG_04693 [Coccidioides posadasii RMSCC 3488]